MNDLTGVPLALDHESRLIIIEAQVQWLMQHHPANDAPSPSDSELLDAIIEAWRESHGMAPTEVAIGKAIMWRENR